MTDFVQTMKDWRRMCRTMEAEHPGDGCNHCPLLDISPDRRGCDAIYADEFADNADWRRLKEIVDIWAQANLEPVYPSIAKYLEQFGITIRRDGSLQADFFKANEPMGADMAKLLGLQPKEG